MTSSKIDRPYNGKKWKKKVYQTLHRKLNIEQHEPPKKLRPSRCGSKTGINECYAYRNICAIIVTGLVYKFYSILYNYHPCWSVTRRFVSQRKVRSPEGFPEGDLTFGRRSTVGSHSNKGDNWYIISKIFASDTK